MRVKAVVVRLSIAFLVAFGATSCAPDKPDTTENRQLTSSGAAGGKVSATSDMPVPPKDAVYTIYCQFITGPDHIERARQLREALRRSTSMKGWYLIYAADQ